MTIFVLGFDRDLLDPHSAAAMRQKAFAERADAVLNIFLLPRADHRADLALDHRIRVRVWEGNAVFRLCALFVAAAKEIRAAKKRGEQALITAQDPFIAGAMAFKLSRWTDVPYEIQEHGDFYSGYWEKEVPFINRFFLIIGRFVLRRADGVRVVSERVRDHLIRRCGVTADRIIVRPVVEDLSWHLHRSARPWPEVPTIIVPCRFVRQKGMDVLIKAFGMLAKDGVRFRARLIGAGPLDAEVRNDIVECGLADRVRIEAWSNQPTLWGDADLFVCSSRYEGWGRTIVEAMAAGVPVVTTDVGCVGSVLRPQIDGRVVQPNDSEALARDIRQQFEEPDRRVWMTANARERVQTMMPTAESSVSLQRSAWQKIAEAEYQEKTDATTPDPSASLGTGSTTQRSHRAWHRILEAENQSALTPSRPHALTPSRRAWLSTTILILFASLVRAASMVLFWQSLGPNRDNTFFILVQNWFLGNGYSFVSAAGCASAYRSPGYLFFLTGIYGLFGFANYFAQALVQNILAVVLVYLVYRLGWAVSKDRRVGLIAGLLISLHPYTFYHYTQYYHTILSGVFLVGLLLALLALERTKRWRWAIGSGILIASLAYIQGTILPATVFLSLWLFIRWWPNWKRAVGAVAVMALVSVALILPWTYRNWTVFHSFVFLTTDMGHAFAKANNSNTYMMNALGYPQEVYEETRDYQKLTVVYTPSPDVVADFRAHGAEVVDGFFFNREHPMEPGLRETCAEQQAFNEVAFDSYWLGLAKGWIGDHYWTEGLRLQIQKAVQFWTPTLQPAKKFGAAWSFGNESLMATLARRGLGVYVFVLEICALIGLAVIGVKKRFGHVAPLLIILGVYTFMHSWFAGYTKYRIPLDNLLVVIAAFTVVALFDAWRSRRGRGTDASPRGWMRPWRRPEADDGRSLAGGSTHGAWTSLRGRWSARLSRLRGRWKAWMTTAVLVSALAGIRLVSYLLFWKNAARIGDPGYKILVQNWFHGFGYSYISQIGCPTAFRSPGYLFFLTGTYLAFGLENYRALFLIQGALVVLAGYLVYRLGRAVSGDRRVGWVALAFFALCPYTVYHYAQYYHTFLSSLFLVALVLALVRLDQTKRIAWAVAAGLAIGCLAYVQGTILPATPFLALWLFIRWRAARKKALAAIAVMAVVSIGLIAPWAYRNWTIFHRFVPLTTDVGYGLYKSNNPYAYGLNALGYSQEVISGESIVNPDNPLLERYFFTPDVEAALRAHGWYEPSSYTMDWHPRSPGVRASCDLVSTLDEPDFSAYWMKQTRAWASAHYWPDFVKLQAQKISQFWSPGLHPSIKSETQWSFGTKSALAGVFVLANTAFMAVVDLLALVGVAFVYRSKRLGAFAPIFIILAVYTVLHSVFAGYTKYRIPLDNLVFVLAACAVVWMWNAWRGCEVTKARRHDIAGPRDPGPS